MTVQSIKKRISECVTAIEFDYKGVHGGVDPFSSNDFDLWYGDNCIKVNSVNEVMSEKFFDDKCLSEILEDIENIEGL